MRSLYCSGRASGWQTLGAMNIRPVSEEDNFSLLSVSSSWPAKKWDNPAVKFAPAEVPPRMKPLVRSTESCCCASGVAACKVSMLIHILF